MFSRPKRNRACDSCRKKKARCNGPDMPGGRCATCITYSVECTYNDPPKRATPKGYVQVLESRLAKLEQLVQKHSSLDTLRSPSSSITHGHMTGSDSTSEDETEAQPKLSPLPARAYSKPPGIDPLSPPDEGAVYSDDEFVTVDETSPTQCLAENSHENIRFYGKSSLAVLTNQVVNERCNETGARVTPNRRKQFWAVPGWMTESVLEPPPVKLEYPDIDLLQHLVDCYFDNLNILLPLLHRPSFVGSIERGLHHTDRSFGATVLLVCAIGCRYTEDPRVTQEITTSTSCTAWRFFNQTHRLKKAHYLSHSLHEAQIYPLAAIFLEGYSPPETPWVTIGVGLRVMQDNGVHRKFSSEKPSLENELWKRAFWVLIVLDRSFSTLLGRPCALQDEDFDTDLPLLCNDEELGESGLKCPPQLPTQMCSFVAVIKLTHILAFALRTLYSTKGSRVVLGYVGKRWEQHILATLDSALTKWTDTVPDHLRPDSESAQRTRTYQVQFAFLWCQFYEVQLHVHRVFALRSPPDPELTASSMIICKNAARQCIGIVECNKDVLLTPLCSHVLIKPMFDACIFLLLIFWRKQAIDYDSREYHAVKVVTEVVQLTSKRWRTSLCLRSILNVLLSMIDGPLKGWKPTIADWDRIKVESILYVDKEGRLSDTEHGRGAFQKFPGGCGRDPLFHNPECCREISPLGSRGEKADLGTLRQSFRMDGPTGYGAIQPGDLPPAELFANHSTPNDGSVVSPSSEHSSPGENEGTSGVYGGSWRINCARVRENPSSVLPMGLVIYNDLMTDIEGTTRFLGQEFQDSILFGHSSTSSPIPTAQYQGQGSDPQSQSAIDGSWERALYNNFLEQISKQAT